VPCARPRAAAAQELLSHLEGGQVGVHLCPRASLTGETPCGHYIRVWAVAAPTGAHAAAHNALVSGTGQFLSGGSNATGGTNVLSRNINATGLSNTGQIYSGTYSTALGVTMEDNATVATLPTARFGGGGGGGGLGGVGGVSGFALRGPGGGGGGGGGLRAGGGSFGARGARRASLGGRPGTDAGRARRGGGGGGGELYSTADTNLSGAMLMSGLFAGTGAHHHADVHYGSYGAAGGGGGYPGDQEYYISGALGHTTMANNTTMMRTAFGALASGIVNRRAQGAPPRAAAGRRRSCRLGAPCLLHARIPAPARRERAPLNPTPRAHPGEPRTLKSSPLAPPPSHRNLVSRDYDSAYIDNTMTGVAYGYDGRPLDVSEANMRPLAMHAFDQVVSGTATTFDDLAQARVSAIWLDECRTNASGGGWWDRGCCRIRSCGGSRLSEAPANPRNPPPPRPSGPPLCLSRWRPTRLA
jgi:hypothetical protein